WPLPYREQSRAAIHLSTILAKEAGEGPISLGNRTRRKMPRSARTAARLPGRPVRRTRGRPGSQRAAAPRPHLVADADGMTVTQGSQGLGTASQRRPCREAAGGEAVAAAVAGGRAAAQDELDPEDQVHPPARGRATA